MWYMRITMTHLKNSEGNSLLPDQSLQPPPEGAQAPPADLLVEPPAANAENFCSTRFPPHLGHSGRSGLRVKTSFSKTCPQWEHAYSKMGMGPSLTPWV